MTQAGPSGTFLGRVGGKSSFLSGAGAQRCKPRAACGQGISFKGQPGENGAVALLKQIKEKRGGKFLVPAIPKASGLAT